MSFIEMIFAKLVCKEGNRIYFVRVANQEGSHFVTDHMQGAGTNL